MLTSCCERVRTRHPQEPRRNESWTYGGLFVDVTSGDGLRDFVGLGRENGELVDVVDHVRSAHGVGTRGQGQRGRKKSSETHIDGMGIIWEVGGEEL